MISPLIYLELTERVLQLGNYDLGVLIILNFELPVSRILTNVVNQLVKNSEFSQVKNLLRRGKVFRIRFDWNEKDLLRTEEDWDNFVINCVKTFVEIGESKMAEGFVSFILMDERKIDCLMWCGQLKKAFILAVKTHQRDKVVKIRDEAKLKNMTTQYRLCVQYLEQNPENTEWSSTMCLFLWEKRGFFDIVDEMKGWHLLEGIKCPENSAQLTSTSKKKHFGGKTKTNKARPQNEYRGDCQQLFASTKQIFRRPQPETQHRCTLRKHIRLIRSLLRVSSPLKARNSKGLLKSPKSSK